MYFGENHVKVVFLFMMFLVKLDYTSLLGIGEYFLIIGKVLLLLIQIGSIFAHFKTAFIL